MERYLSNCYCSILKALANDVHDTEFIPINGKRFTEQDVLIALEQNPNTITYKRNYDGELSSSYNHETMCYEPAVKVVIDKHLRMRNVIIEIYLFGGTIIDINYPYLMVKSSLMHDPENLSVTVSYYSTERLALKNHIWCHFSRKSSGKFSNIILKFNGYFDFIKSIHMSLSEINPLIIYNCSFEELELENDDIVDVYHWNNYFNETDTKIMLDLFNNIIEYGLLK